MSTATKDGRELLCPLCDGTGAITNAQADALQIGATVWQLPIGDATEQLGQLIADIAGRAVVDILADYHVALVRTEVAS